MQVPHKIVCSFGEFSPEYGLICYRNFRTSDACPFLIVHKAIMTDPINLLFIGPTMKTLNAVLLP